MIKSFERMFSILSLYSMDRTSLSISEIEKELGFPKSAIFRILQTLIENEYIKQDTDSQRYMIGKQFFRLGSIFQSQLDIRGISLPFMKTLSNKTLETIELNIIDETNRLCIEKISSPLTVRNFVQIGERHPLHQGASGKLLLAFQQEAQKKQLLCSLEKEYEIDTKRLKNDLAGIYKQGYAFTEEERVLGSFAISAPVFDQQNKIIAGLTISGPVQRLSNHKAEELITQVMEASQDISEQFGNFVASNRKVLNK